MSWWHGGPRVVGNEIRPPLETGFCRSGGDDGEFPDVVFVARERGLALTYAATCDGWLYEVEPIGELRQDPLSILPEGDSMMCDRARILRRFRPSRAEVQGIVNVFGHIAALMGES